MVYILTVALLLLLLGVIHFIFSLMTADRIPDIHVALSPEESSDAIENRLYDEGKHKVAGSIPCYDPCTMQLLGQAPAMTPAQVVDVVNRAKQAAKVWRSSSFVQRRFLLKILQRFILNNQELICRVAARDSGKTMVDAALGETLVTCEKIDWLVRHGEKYLRPEYRRPGALLFYKRARVEYHPLGVVGAIVPWNYPFHNVMNPLVSAVFAGNAAVIKVSEHTSWSASFLNKVIKAALRTAGAPEDLVTVITGYGDAGQALVTSVDKVIFVGSTAVGRHVMTAAATTLTPVTLELGGKDPFIICDDADMNEVVHVALRSAYQSCGQNCVAAERFIVQRGVYDRFVADVARAANAMRQGAPLQSRVDCGAMCMPGAAEKVHELVADAVSKGARRLAGGVLPSNGAVGQFYPPTVLADVTRDMRIWREEVFGPVLVVASFNSDEQAVEMANDCVYGLGSSVWSRNAARANAIASRLECGMTAINDFASNYMCQSLPFGGVKESGFGRFGGVEGLRAMCVVKAVCDDRFPTLMRTTIPPPMQYPIGPHAFPFVISLTKLFYGMTWRMRFDGLVGLIRVSLSGKPKPEACKTK